MPQGLISRTYDWLRGKSKESVRGLLEEAAKWQPTSTYDADMDLRVKYLDGEMHDDALTFLKAEFQDTSDEMINHMQEYPLCSYIATKRAREFENSQFLLVDESRKPAEPDSPAAQAWAEVVRKSGLETSLARASRLRDQQGQSYAKAWWDIDHVRVSPFPAGKVKIVPNVMREWDPYSAVATMFARTGVGGIGSPPRWEIWASRSEDMIAQVDAEGNPIFSPTLHYIADQDGYQEQVNDTDTNPLVDEEGKPFVPFVRFTENPDVLYWASGSALINFNRVLNLAFTQMQAHVSWGMLGYPVITAAAGSNFKAPAIQWFSPARFLKLAAGQAVEFARNDILLVPITGTLQLMQQLQTMFAGLDPAIIKLDSTAPESGYAIKVRYSSLVQYIRRLQPIMQPDVDHLLLIMKRMHNYYRKGLTGPSVPAEIPQNLTPKWFPGQIEAGPVDAKELAEYYPQAIDRGAATVEDWVSEWRGVDKVEAKKLVDENLKRNSEISKANTAYPENQDAGLKGAIDKLKGMTGDNQTGEKVPPEKQQPATPAK